MIRTLKTIRLLLAGVLSIMMLTGCWSNKSGGSNAKTIISDVGTSSNQAKNDSYEITLVMPSFGAVPKDVEAVQAEINKITKEQINATVRLLLINIGSWQQQMNLMTSGGEKLDLVFSFSSNYNNDVTKGKMIALDDLLVKYGQGIKQSLPLEYLKSAQVGGKTYAIPSVKSYGGRTALIMRKDLVDKYHIDVASIQSLDDVETIFKMIKANEPTIVPLASGISSPWESYQAYDKLGDRLGVLPNFDNGMKVENLFEMKEYETFLERMHSWFKAGYINKDAATSQINEYEYVKANKAFSYIVKNRTGFADGQVRLTGKNMVIANLQTHTYSTTDDVLAALWTVSKNSANPERAMMFLDLMYRDKNIVNLLMWGIEGKHYVKVSDSVIDYPIGVDSQTVGYSNQSWLIGNSFLTYTLKGEDPELWMKTKAENEQIIKSKALGFYFDAEPVHTEITALKNVMDQYRRALETGSVDPAVKLPEFRSKLKAAGIENVIAEKQKQLNEWAVANKK